MCSLETCSLETCVTDAFQREEGLKTPTNSTDEVKAELEKARKESHDKIKLLEEKLAATEKEMSRIVQEKTALDKEHEDLLVMLTEQDAKVLKYKVHFYCYYILHYNRHISNLLIIHRV